MKENYLKNSIISFVLIVSVLSMPFAFLPKKAEAANIATYVSGLSGVIKQLPLCANELKNLFSKGSSDSSGAFNSNGQEIYGDSSGEAGTSNSNGQEIYSGDNTLTGQNDSATSMSEDVHVIDTNSEKSNAATATAAEKAAAAAAALKANDTCLKSIGRAVIKMLLQKITTDTVKWINTGYSGEPMFVQNPGDYFLDIAKNEILRFNSEINDPVLYPFGKAFIQAQADSFRTKFADNAQYSLNKMIQDTNPQFSAQTFSQDFSQGGWGAWDAMTQNPANNPLGFALMASNELAKRIEDKTQLATGSLQQSGGYLGVQKCVDPEGITKQQDDEALKSGDKNDPNLCHKWNFVTPGQMVAAAATKAVNYPENNLLSAQDLNDAVAAILDALLNSFSSSLMGEGGFAGLSDTTEFQQGAEGQFVMNYDNTVTYNNSQINDFSGLQVAGSSFLTQNPNFNIRTDFNQAIIDEQRIFVDKLIEQNKELKSTVPLDTGNNPPNPDGSMGYFTGNYGLIPIIYQLDYCIPGPHPGWETDSRAALSAALNAVVPETIESIDKKNTSDIQGLVQTLGPLVSMAAGMVVGAAVGSVVPIIGNAVGLVVGALVGALIGLIGTSDKKKIRQYYAGAIGVITGLRLEIDKYNNSGATQNWGPFADAMNLLLDRYIKLMWEVYNPNVMPSVTKEAVTKFGQAKGYNQMFTNNEDRITSIKSVITRLDQIKIEVDQLNKDLSTVNTDGSIGNIKDINGNRAPNQDVVDVDGNITKMGQQSQYEENLKPWISAFARLSAEMVAGDDVALVDNTIKQITDEKDYIYKDLLKGPNGCEKELERGIPGMYWRIYNEKRIEYPGPILYDYNKYSDTNNNKTWVFPDPYGNGQYKNTMNTLTLINNDGPGFLSMFSFQSNTTTYYGNLCPTDGAPITNEQWKQWDNQINHPCVLEVGSDIPLKSGEGWTSSLGIINPGYGPEDNRGMNGLFESSIGVW